MAEEHSVDYLRETFALFDKDNDELPTLLRVLGLNPTNADIAAMVKDADPNGTGQIDLRAFVTLMRRRASKMVDTQAEMYEALKVFDKSGSGLLTIPELRQLMTELGEKLTEAEVQEIVREVDKNNDGVINLEVLGRLMMARSRDS